MELLTDKMTVLLELKNQLSINGIERFSRIKDTEKDIMTSCPFHKDGQESKPSFGISKDEDKCHCFACGWSGTFEEMISNCFGYDDFGVYGTKWLAKNFNTISVDERKDVSIDVDRGNKVRKVIDKDNRLFVDEDELDSYRYIHPYMYKRHLTNEVIDLFDIGYDKNTQCITFPNKDEYGNCLFIARRSVNTKYFNYPSNVDKPVYGLYELYQLDKFPTEIYICESMINALTLWTWGKYAVALNGTGSSKQYEALKRMPNRVFILALDPDGAGNKGREKLKGALCNKIIKEVFLPQGKDVNDCTQEEFFNLKEVFN